MRLMSGELLLPETGTHFGFHNHPYLFQPIFSFGSSGGWLSVSIVIKAQLLSLPLPSQVVTISPATTFMLNLDPQIIPRDRILSPDFTYRVAYTFANVPIPPSVPISSITPPISIQMNPVLNTPVNDFKAWKVANVKLVVVTGTWCLFHTNALNFAKIVSDAGVKTTLIEGENQFHSFSIALDVDPECMLASELMVKQVIENGSARVVSGL